MYDFGVIIGYSFEGCGSVILMSIAKGLTKGRKTEFRIGNRSRSRFWSRQVSYLTIVWITRITLQYYQGLFIFKVRVYLHEGEEDDRDETISHGIYIASTWHPQINHFTRKSIWHENDENEGAIYCNGCNNESIWGGYAYECISCRYFLHMISANLIPIINHHSYHPHPLILIDDYCPPKCAMCYKSPLVRRGLSIYTCQIWDEFYICTQCGLAKEEASVKFNQ
ncbi:hypothetical protein OSB04_012327 [Centaurea solstitialis]|uniref:Uncharacterized protein n=1 Tax=Centaurea solstitialis TaxID=347529 RepID=A0AA38TB71_9ASTR|nr:hypothetical protein OSB04_012327 [Centaurea solstitialis]